MRLTEFRSDGYWSTESEECATDPVPRYLGDDGEWKAGVRPPSVVETPADLEWLFANRDTAQPQVVCRWCGATARPIALDPALRWFATHPCAQGLAA